MEKLVVILGPTCTGKTSLAEGLCLKYNGEIVSADSRQVYQYMDIGTGKLPKSQHVVTHLQDVVLPNREYSVARWAESARRVVDEIWQRGKVPFIVGGTGFYIDVLLGNRQTAGIAPNYALRAKLEEMSCDKLFEKLKKLDPERAEVVDKHNKRRLVRAIEIAKAETAKENPSGFLGFQPDGLRNWQFSPLTVGLKSSKEFLYKRADRWVEKVLENDALLKETAGLVERGCKNTPPLQGLIYKTALDYFDHRLSYEEMKQRIKFDMHAYIRRQLTWFKKSPPRINWLNIAKADCGQKVDDMLKFYLDG